MYNPINMKVEDEQRLIDKDIRDKNKKKRYEVRMQVEISTREEGLAEQDRLDHMSLRKISHKHTEEQVNRNYNILTGGQLDNAMTLVKKEQTDYLKRPAQTWGHIQGAPDASAQVPKSSASVLPIVELQRTQFGDRSTRVNLLTTQKSHHSQSVAPSSKRSEIRSGGFQKLGAELAK